jgi:CxxC motif-containing protein
MLSKSIICTVCPMGCNMNVSGEDQNVVDFKIDGNKCNRGVDYAIKEITNPTRVLTSTVAISNAFINRIPVKSSEPIPKAFLKEAMKIIGTIVVQAPQTSGDLIVKDILGTGVDIIASRSLDKI